MSIESGLGPVPHIVVLDRASLPMDDLDFSRYGRVTLWDNTRADEVAQRISAATVVVTNKVPIDAAALASAPMLRMIAVPATGLNHLDLDTCAAKGIVVRNCEGYADTGIAEHVMSLILALRRNLIGFRTDLRQGLWSKSPNFSLFTRNVTDIKGQTLSIVGNGRLGSATANLARAMGMEVLLAERKGEADARPGYVPFQEALSRSDVISLHCPLTADTARLIGSSELRTMKPDALLINTSRGGLVDEAALLEALRQNRIAGAGLDVVDGEPPTPEHMLVNADLPNLIVTPHVAWISSRSLARLAEMLFEHLDSFAAHPTQSR